MSSDEEIDALAKELRTNFENFGDVSDMLMALKVERQTLREALTFYGKGFDDYGKCARAALEANP